MQPSHECALLLRSEDKVGRCREEKGAAMSALESLGDELLVRGNWKAAHPDESVGAAKHTRLFEQWD